MMMILQNLNIKLKKDVLIATTLIKIIQNVDCLIYLRKKFDTTIIGSLAAFEERFGDLWGHGLSMNDLDEDQRYWRDVWMETSALKC